MTTQNPEPQSKDLAHGRAGQEESKKPADYELWRAADEASAAALALLRQVSQVDEILQIATSEEYVLFLESRREIINSSLELIGQAGKLLLRKPREKPLLDVNAIVELMKSRAPVPKEPDDSKHKD